MQRDWVLLVVCLGALAGCAGDEQTRPRLPYATDKTTVIGDFDNPDDSARFQTWSTPDGAECINLDDACVKPQDVCGDDGAADVLLNERREAVDVICYPTDGVAIEDLEGEVEDVGNDVVLVLDDADDGVDVQGDVTIDGNNVTLWGHGPDNSVIGGDLAIEKNNAVVRGVRIQGDLVITKNNASLVDCVIEGDVTIAANNTSIALCVVWGTLTIEGNNTVLVGNRLAASPTIAGNETTCNGNVAFTDDNEDHTVEDDELGDVIECSSKPEADQ
jgi:hypothetical protein